MSELGFKPDQLQPPEKPPENPVIRARFNERFKLPKPTLPQELPIRTGGGAGLTPIQTYDLEISRGEDEQVIRGQVTVSADTDFLADVTRHQTEYTKEYSLLCPDGEVDFKVVRRQAPGDIASSLFAKELPLVVAISTRSTYPKRSQDQHNVKHFFSCKGHQFEGRATPNNIDANTPFNKWSEPAAHVDGNGLIYLPYSPDVFDNLEIVIGDIPPQPPQAE